MAEISQKTGLPIEVMTFIGSSPIRALAEDWSVELIEKRSIDAISFGVKEGLPVNYVTEDTTRSDPKVLYAATYQRLRKAFGFNGGGPGSAI